MREISIEELRENFDHFDANQDGKIDQEEFCALMSALGADEPDPDSTIGFRAIDSDGSGVIDFDEFSRWFATL